MNSVLSRRIFGANICRRAVNVVRSSSSAQPNYKTEENEPGHTHFGFQTVKESEKEKKGIKFINLNTRGICNKYLVS